MADILAECWKQQFWKAGNHINRCYPVLLAANSGSSGKPAFAAVTANPVHLLTSVLQLRYLEVGSSLKYVVMSWQKLRFVEHVELHVRRMSKQL